jgi:hypothetical protein
MAWKDWSKELPSLKVVMKNITIKRRSAGQDHVLYKIVDPVTVENRKSGEILEVPVGFLCDGSSVPGPLWAALDANPVDLLVPGIVHDYAYREDAKVKKPGGGTRKLDRYEADLIHVAISKMLRVKKSDQAKIFYALRVGGKFAWRDRRVDWDGHG